MKIWIATLLFLAAPSFAANCSITIKASMKMVYDTKEISIPLAKCKKFKVTLKYDGSLPKAVMGHNIVFSKSSDVDAIVKAAIPRGIKNDYLPIDKRVIAATKMIGGGKGDPKEDTITLDMSKFKKGTEYKFFCTFPGHLARMQGLVKLI